jgi:hypothetical protein
MSSLHSFRIGVGRKASGVVASYVMSKVDELRRYAEEAMLAARQAKTEKARAILLNIALAWTAAAAYREANIERAAEALPIFGMPHPRTADSSRVVSLDHYRGIRRVGLAR